MFELVEQHSMLATNLSPEGVEIKSATMCAFFALDRRRCAVGNPVVYAIRVVPTHALEIGTNALSRQALGTNGGTGNSPGLVT
jgi:hypothetical protein